MTSAPTTLRPTYRQPADGDTYHRLRLRLKPKAHATGFVDGGWWPRSWDLGAELPDLLAVLAVRLGRVERVGYHLGQWDVAGHKIRVDGCVVRLEGFRAQHVNTVDLVADHQRITLLVVPPDLPKQDAHAALMAAGRRDDTDDVESLLTPR